MEGQVLPERDGCRMREPSTDQGLDGHSATAWSCLGPLPYLLPGCTAKWLYQS